MGAAAESRWRWPVSAAICVLAGVLQAWSLAWPWHGAGSLLAHGQPMWWLQLLSLAMLAAQVQRAARARQAAWLGWLFGTAWLSATFWWLFISMHTYGGLAAPLAAIALGAKPLTAEESLNYSLGAVLRFGDDHQLFIVDRQRLQPTIGDRVRNQCDIEFGMENLVDQIPGIAGIEFQRHVRIPVMETAQRAG